MARPLGANYTIRFSSTFMFQQVSLPKQWYFFRVHGMLKSIVHRYFIVIVACIALLIGIQIPNLADQYQKRIDAHLREVTIDFQPFQEIANKYFNGNIEKLIELHRKSDVKAFQDEAVAIEKMFQRKQRFEAELAALQTTLANKLLHIAFNRDREMMDETMAQYTYAVPLNEDALIVGAISAILILSMVELLLVLASFATNLLTRKTA
jgi:hypothetical protein